MTVLHWVRHGPTGARGMLGHLDRPADLSDLAALARLSAALPPRAPVASSDLLRATATAEAIAAGRPRLAPDRALREIDFGAWDGLAVEEVPDQAALRAFWDEPGAAAPPGGESWDALRARVDPAVDALIALGHPDLIVVAHMGVILAQVQRALGVSAHEAFGHRIEPLSVTRIAAGGAGAAAGAGAVPSAGAGAAAPTAADERATAGGWRVEAINLRP